jgi:Tfp pilus assembly PilM family ATPase
MLKLDRTGPPVRRVLALDAGSRCLKLLLAESDFGRLRILKEELIDLQAEGLVSAGEVQAHLQSRLAEWGRPALALVLPQHLAISQVVDLPLAPENEVDKLIEHETIKLGGVSESRILYDFVRTETAAQNRQQFWVTVAQEGDIRERILQLGLEQEELCDITTTANALIAAYRAAQPLSSRAILVHLGAQTTVVIVVLAGQGVFATSFQMGGDFFTRALARLRNCPEEAAEGLKRSQDLLAGPEALPEFIGVVDGWVAELKRQLNEWFEHNPASALEAASFELVASGGGFDQPGLLGYLKTQADLDLQAWPRSAQPEAAVPTKCFEAAYGTALQALGYSAQPVSLLPEDYRAARRQRLRRQRLEVASLVVAALCVLVFAAATWHQVSLAKRKQALLTKLEAGQEALEAHEALTEDLAVEYEGLRPLFAAQQNTLDTLRTLALLQESRTNRGLWYVLLADQQSYFDLPAGLAVTNRLSRTNVFAPPAVRSRGGPADFPPLPVAATNPVPAKPGYIAEFCLPGDADAARKVRRDLVDELKQQRLFSKVDLLSDDLRRNLADPKVTIPDREVVLALDFADVEFQQPLPVKKLAPRASNPRPLRALRQTTPGRDAAEPSAP